MLDKQFLGMEVNSKLNVEENDFDFILIKKLLYSQPKRVNIKISIIKYFSLKIYS